MTKNIERITINKNDEAAVVVEKLIDSEAEEIVFNIPRFSKLAESLANFHLIKRESDLLKKKVIIESVDDKVIELAELAKLESLNPFFVKSRRQFSDIVVGSRSPESKSPIAIIKSRAVKEKPMPVNSPSIARPSLRKTLFIIAIAVLGLILLIVMIRILPRAEIKIVTKKINWNFNNSVFVDKAAAEIDSNNSKIPGQLFNQRRNLELLFSASGKRKAENYAGGKITVYNAYSSDPQPLVAKTRFLAPDGKIFRLVKGVTVPGAKISEGKIVPSSIEVEVVADQPGAEYNIGPVARFTIPGLKGTPKYEAFYGESKSSMSGGFIGEVGYPTDDDIKTARSELKKKLEDALAAVIVAQIPADFKILNNAQETIFGAIKVESNLDQSGNFRIFGEATKNVMAFREADVLEMLSRKISAESGADFKIKEFTIEYGEPRADFQKGIVSFPVKFNAVVFRGIDFDDLKQKLLGQSENDLKAKIFSLPGLDSAQISLWPFWVKKVPTNAKKINLLLE